MKYLTNYIEDQMSKCHKDNGAFYAFSDKQFNEQKKPDTKYISLGSGAIVPEINAKQFVDQMSTIVKNGIAQDITENGQDGVITRELANHEAYYTGSIESTIDALDGYNFTDEAILTVFKRENAKGQPLTA
jgi:hypothetical protein